MVFARLELRWAVITGILGAVITAVVAVRAILGSTSSTAAIGLLFLPIPMGMAAIPSALWGAALGHLVARWRGAPGRRSLAVAAAIVVAALPAWAGREAWRGLTLQSAVRAVPAMDARALDQAFERSPWNRNRFFVGALARNRAASAQLLDRIANLPDAGLFAPMGSMLWDVMGTDRRGIAVMRVVASHPNTSAETLQRLAAHPTSDKIRYELLANPHTPVAVRERWYDSTSEDAELGLAVNPDTPVPVFERLARSPHPYTRMFLCYNSAVPEDIVQRLSKDRDPMVARQASIELARRLREKQAAPFGESS